MLNEYEISKLKKELQRKQQLLKEEQDDREYTEKQLVQVQAERDKYYSELLIARQQIQNIDSIIAENVQSMKLKLQQENSASLKELGELRHKLSQERRLKDKIIEENTNKDAIINELSARLRELSRKYKDPSLLVNTKEISEQAMITHHQFRQLTEKCDKLSRDMENILAQNKILRKLHGVPDNFGFDLEEIKIAEKQELNDYKAQCRKLETQIEELQAERTQLRYRLRQYNTLYSNKGDRYKDMTLQQLELLDAYALNLKEGKVELPQIDKSQKQMEREILKLRAQVQVLQNKMPVSIGQFQGKNDEKMSNEQVRRLQQQIKSTLEPFVQDIKKLSSANLNSIVQSVQNIQKIEGIRSEMGQIASSEGFKGPIPLPVAHNDWSKIKQGYSFLYSSKIPVDLKSLENDVSFDTVKAKYEIAALQLQNIESLKLLKQKQKVQTQLSKELLDLKQKYKKCLKVQDKLFVDYFRKKEQVQDRIKKLQIANHGLMNEKQQIEVSYKVLQQSFNSLQAKNEQERLLKDYSIRLSQSQANVQRLKSKYEIISKEQNSLDEKYINLKLNNEQTQKRLEQKLIKARNNERQLTQLLNMVLEEARDAVSSDVHNTLLTRMQIMNDKAATMINKETQLRIKVEKLESVERDANIKDQIIENLREDNLDILLELEVVRNRLKVMDPNYKLFLDTFDRLISFVNENNVSLMGYFKKFDKDASGELSKKEFESSLKSLGFSMNTQELDILFAEFDLDGSNSVTYKEFLRKMRRGGALSRSQEEQAVLKLFKAIKHAKLSIRQAFQIIDADGSNAISKSEMRSALTKIGISTNEKALDHLFRLCDYDNDGSISCQELEKLYKQMIRESEVLENQVYSEELDWKLAFVLKFEEASLKFHNSLVEAFKTLDDDNNSVLTIDELSQFLKKADLSFQGSSLKELFDFLDRKRDGRVEYHEFLKVLAEAKSEQRRIQRIKYIKERTNQLKIQSQRQINSRSLIETQKMTGLQAGESEKMKIRIQALQTKQSNLVKKNQKLAKELATKEQQLIELKKELQNQEKQKIKNYDDLTEEKLEKVKYQDLAQNAISKQQAKALEKEINQLKIKQVQLTSAVNLYKGLYEGLTDKNKSEELRIAKIISQRNKYYDLVKDFQATSDLNAKVGHLTIQLQHSIRKEQMVNSKYDKVVQDLRKIDEENRKLLDLSTEKEKDLINTHVMYQQKGSLLQRRIDDLTLRMVPTVTLEKMENFLIKLREISQSKSSLQEENRLLREKNFNLQTRNDYVQNQKVHIEELERKLRNTYTDEASKSIIDLTKRVSELKMTELKAKRQMGLLREKQEYYMRINNNHTENIQELEEEISKWESKYNEREQFWRKKMADQAKLMEEFQREASKAKEQQLKAMSFFQERRQEEQKVQRKYQSLSTKHHENVSQFIRPTSDHRAIETDDQYTEKLLAKISDLEQQLMDKQNELHQFKSAVKQMVPQANVHKFMDFGSQMGVSTNSFVLQTQLTGSQLKNNARRFLNNQKDIEAYYKEENARITQAAQQSIDTLQRIIDDKNQQLKKKERTLQDLKKQFMESRQNDFREIQKLHEQLKDLRASKEMNSLNQIMARTTKNNFYTNKKADEKTEEYLQLLEEKDKEIRSWEQKYDKLLLSKKERAPSMGKAGQQRLQQKLQELMQVREQEKRKYLEKQKQLENQVLNLKKTLNVKSKKIDQLNNALIDIKNDIMSEKANLSQGQVEANLEQFVTNMTKASNKNDAAMEQAIQSTLGKAKKLEEENKQLRGQLSRTREGMMKTANKGFKR